MKVEQHLLRIQAAHQALEAETRLLSKLPREFDVENLFRLNGAWSVRSSAPLDALLGALPPCHSRVVREQGSFVLKPQGGPVDWNTRYLPLTVSDKGTFWFHQLSDGEFIGVYGTSGLLNLPEGYGWQHGAHNRAISRRVRTPVTFQKSPEDLAAEKWHAFFKAENYTASQKAIANMLRAHVEKDRPLDIGMLPRAAPTTMEVAGAPLEMRYAGNAAPQEVLPPGSPLVALHRWGPFWRCFTKEQAERLVAFAQSCQCNLAEVQRAEVEKGTALALAALETFAESYLKQPMASSGVCPEVLTHWVRAETGYPVQVSVRDNPTTSRLDGVHWLWVYLWKWNTAAELVTPMEAFQPTGFDWENPSFYEYEPNSGTF